MVVEVIKGLITILVIFFIFILVFTPSASAWYVTTHGNIAEKIYYSMPAHVQQNLNLSEMRRGAAAPDLIFKDSQYGYHSYPKSYEKAEYWLKQGETAYQNGKYTNASYSFGVASHYISDSYVAPHCANISKYDHIDYENKSKEMGPSALYAEYENQSINMKYVLLCMNESLKLELTDAYKTGETRWNIWFETRNMTLVQQDLDNATSISYNAIRNRVY